MKLAGPLKPSARLPHLSNLKERDLSEGIRVRYLGREGQIFKFEIGKFRFFVEEPHTLKLMSSTLEIRTCTAFGSNNAEVRVKELENPQMAYFGRDEVRVEAGGKKIAVSVCCDDASLGSLDIKKGEIIVKIKVSKELQYCRA